tara:strand:+ start:27313 stop:28614 length:1302 start_codon:yes stop_codon:yes gene_type:complete
MATYKELSAGDIKTSKSVLNQLVDVVQEDISGSTTRQKHLVWVTGGLGPGVTSSMFQTVWDQDYTLQSANPVFDVTVGLYSGSGVVTGSQTGIDSSGKPLFPSSSMMMREKVDIYRQFAQLLMGDAEYQFSAPFDTSGTPIMRDGIDAAIFLCFRRLFARDAVKKETFAMKFYASASYSNGQYDRGGANTYTNGAYGFVPTMQGNPVSGTNLNTTTHHGPMIITDIGSVNGTQTVKGGEVAELVDSSNTANNVGLLFYDAGIAVLDLHKVMSASQHVSGVIDAMTTHTAHGTATGKTTIGHHSLGAGNPDAKFIPDFLVSGSVDNILDHICATRFSSGTNTAMTFQNITNINSTLIFCRARADEFNYSSNPTYTDGSGNINVIEDTTTDRSFTFITSIGLYDSKKNLLAVAKLSRPVEKNDEKDITFRVRLDF